jgi:hypothetical protein
MKRPTPQEAIGARCNEFTICIKMLLDTKHTLPALVLLYSAIDVFASLTRPESEPDTNGGHFKKWTNDYLIGPSRLKVTSEDLWGARCGLLHTHSPSSRDSRQGKAHELAYYRTHAPTPDLQRMMETTLKVLQTKGKLPLDVDTLSAAFENGVRLFLSDIQRDPELEKRALHHCSKVFGVVNSGAKM